MKFDQCPSCGEKKSVTAKVCRRCYWRPKSDSVCPSCGGSKRPSSKICLKCHYSSSSPRRIKEPCPQCGRPKLKEAQLCMSCRRHRDDLPELPGKEAQRETLRRPDWDKITNQFLHQFLGLFLGEGCVRIRVNKVGSLSINLQIKLRSDDFPALEYVQKYLGGSLIVEQHKGNPEARWGLFKQEDVQDLLVALEPLLLIPMRKAQELALTLEYLRWRETQPFHGLDRSVCQDYFDRLTELRRYV